MLMSSGVLQAFNNNTATLEIQEQSKGDKVSNSSKFFSKADICLLILGVASVCRDLDDSFGATGG